MSTLMRGLVVAGAVALVVVMSTLLGLPSPWPVLLVAAVSLARPVRPGILGAVLVGSVTWWVAMALRAGVLPDATSSAVLAAVIAVVVCTAVAAGTGERLPLWAGLAGMALFAGLYEPMFAANPTRFLSESFVALGSVVVAVGIGALIATVTEALGAERPEADRLIVLPTTEGVS